MAGQVRSPYGGGIWAEMWIRKWGAAPATQLAQGGRWEWGSHENWRDASVGGAEEVQGKQDVPSLETETQVRFHKFFGTQHKEFEFYLKDVEKLLVALK